MGEAIAKMKGDLTNHIRIVSFDLLRLHANKPIAKRVYGMIQNMPVMPQKATSIPIKPFEFVVAGSATDVTDKDLNKSLAAK